MRDGCGIVVVWVVVSGGGRVLLSAQGWTSVLGGDVHVAGSGPGSDPISGRFVRYPMGGADSTFTLPHAGRSESVSRPTDHDLPSRRCGGEFWEGGRRSDGGVLSGGVVQAQRARDRGEGAVSHRVGTGSASVWGGWWSYSCGGSSRGGLSRHVDRGPGTRRRRVLGSALLRPPRGRVSSIKRGPRSVWFWERVGIRPGNEASAGVRSDECSRGGWRVAGGW